MATPVREVPEVKATVVQLSPWPRPRPAHTLTPHQRALVREYEYRATSAVSAVLKGTPFEVKVRIRPTSVIDNVLVKTEQPITTRQELDVRKTVSHELKIQGNQVDFTTGRVSAH